MPAKSLSRVDKDGIYCHIYNKGIEKRIIFNDEEDYETFLGYLKDYLTAPKDPKSIKKEFSVNGRTFRGTPHQPKNYFNKVELIAFCLMPDHFHLLLHQAKKGPLENFIRSLCTRYSIYFNKKYKRTGALFDGPYKSLTIKDNSYLSFLTRYFHQIHDYSSYPEYLGTKETSWIKPKVVLSSFDKGALDYKEFVEKHELDQKEKELIESLALESETDHLERRILASNEEITLETFTKPHSRVPAFIITSIVMFFVLVGLGIRTINVSAAKGSQPLPTSIQSLLNQPQSEPTPAVLAESASAEPLVDKQVKLEKNIKPKEDPKVMLKVKIDDGSESVNIRKKPTTNSEIIDKAKDGQTFEFVSSLDSGWWYQVKLADGSFGFIYAPYITLEDEKTND